MKKDMLGNAGFSSWVKHSTMKLKAGNLGAWELKPSMVYEKTTCVDTFWRVKASYCGDQKTEWFNDRNELPH